MTSVPDHRDGWAAPERAFSATGNEPTGRPNILFILADDLGWGDLGCYGSLHQRTPVLDRLAADGLRFRHAYAASPTCSPTRIALYTGRYPARLPAGLQEPLTDRDEHSGIPHGHPTLPSLLRAAGYDTAMFGKWHCGWLPWFSPLRIGFDVFFGNLDGAVDYFSHIDTLGRHDLYEGETPIEQIGYYTDLISERAAGYIAGHDPRRPFYVQVNYTAPHWPWEGPHDKATSDRITAAARTDPLTALFHFDGGSLDTYRRMVEALDAGIGTILGSLDASGRRDNTIVVFTSDNGGERYAFMWPFVGEKGDLEEGGIRVPLLLRWPEAVEAGQVTDLENTTLDWTATLLGAAGATAHRQYSLDGTSLLPWLLRGQPPSPRTLLWRTKDQGAARRGRYKLLVDRQAKPLWLGRFAREGERIRLFDVAADGREKADLSGQHPDVLHALTQEWRAFDAAMLDYHPARQTSTSSRPD